MTHDEQVAEAAKYLHERGFGQDYALAIVLGSGLGTLAHGLANARSVPYAAIPHMPVPGVSGHGGRLIAGTLAGRPVLVFSGRAHAYETGDTAAMRVPVGLVRALGGPPLLLTNAAGSLRPDLGPGSLVSVSDHIAIGLPNPLVGMTGDARFVSMAEAYDPALRRDLVAAAGRADVPLGQGVYMWFSGPSFETPAEIRAARTLGADLVGMSTVAEVILARHAGLRVAAVSVVTNFATGMAPASGGVPAGASHDETRRVGQQAAPALGRLLAAYLGGA